MQASERMMKMMTRKPNESRVCRKCGTEYPITEFRFTSKATNKRHNICKHCRQIHRKFVREAKQHYDELLKKQNNSCAICGITADESNDKLIIDHNHDTLIVRGIVCSYCNKGLGFFKDSPTRLAMAIEYLVKHDGITS